MEVGKLVTSEACGNIFYFVVDETHPDEPQPDASRCYYVVAPAASNFSYREAYCVLCRALCGLENRTYLHRWHALYEQIFGTTPYVHFVNAVRDSPLTQPNSFHHAPAFPGGADGLSRPTITLPALFLDETTARLALRKAEQEQTAESEAETQKAQERQSSHNALLQQPGGLQGCSTPLSKPVKTRRVNAVAVEGAVGEPTKQQAAVAAAVEQNTELLLRRNTKATEGAQKQKLDTVLGAASLRREYTSAVAFDDNRRTPQQLRHDLRRERRQRLEAEERCYHQTRALEEAPASLQRREEQAVTSGTIAAAAAADIAPTEKQRTPAEPLRKEVQQLKRRVQELEAELADAKRRHMLECDSAAEEKEALNQQLWQRSQAQGAQISGFLRENADAVKRVEEALEKREKELCAVYTRALEDRDVRIAQLSQEVLQHLHSSRQLATSRGDQEKMQAERVAHLEDMTSHLKEWNVVLRRQVSESAEEIRELRQRLQDSQSQRQQTLIVEREEQQQPSSFPASLSLRCSVCGGLPHAAAVQLATHLRDAQTQLLTARTDAERKSQELNRAAQAIEQLTRGVKKAKLDVESCFHHTVNTIDPLHSITAAQSIV